MSETNYYWQGGRRIEITKDGSQVTIQAPNVEAAQGIAARAGVELRGVSAAAPGMVRAEIIGDRETAVARLRDEEVTHHVYRTSADPGQEVLITESFFVKFKPDTPDARIQAYIQAENLIVEQAFGDKTFLMRVTDETGRNPIRTANAAATRSDIEYAEPNLMRELTRFAFIPTDSEFPRQWHLHAPADAPPALVKGAGIFAPEAWDVTRGRRDIVIAVADDGFDLTHPDFQGVGKVVGSFDARPDPNGTTITWGTDVTPQGNDYHGTPCLGVAVAEGNGTGVVGVAPGCALLAVRFPIPSISDAQLILMFQKISPLADVVSCSWGYGPANAPMNSTLSAAITTLSESGGRRGKGLVFCVAAGNNNCPIKDLANNKTYRYKRGFSIRSYSGPIDRWIAAHPKIIVVGASTSRKTRSAYSSWGPEISVCAPSNNFDDLELTTPTGLGIVTTDNDLFGTGFSDGRFTDRFGGTSSATPTVAGVCGLILSVNPGLTAAEVRSILESTADKDMNVFSDTTVNEPGDFNSAGHSLWFGHGKVNAFNAVRKAGGAPQGSAIVDRRVAANLAIPDDGTPVFSQLDITVSGELLDVRVELDVTHTYIGDLRIDLVTPAGTSIVLHNNYGGSSDNIRRRYSSQNVPAMRTLDRKAAAGNWQLRLVDSARRDVGTLNSWRFTAQLTDAAPPPMPLANAANDLQPEPI